MKDQATKQGEARKMRYCGCQNAQPMRNASPTAKVIRDHHQEGSLEAIKKGEKGSDNIPSGHHEPHE